MSGPVLIAYDATTGGHLGLLAGLDLEPWRGRSLHLLAVVTTPLAATFEPDTAGLEAMGAELVVVAHARGRSWAQRWWQGCLPKALLDRSPCNVLVVMTA